MKTQLDSVKNAEDVLSMLPALPFNDRKQLPSRSGIYFVTYLVEEILYIGKTNNFHTRWIAHHKLNEIKKLYDTNNILISFCELPSDKIDITEASLIKKLTPALNISIVPKEILNQAKKWLSSKQPSSTDIPRELRLWVHKQCRCTCQVCGALVEDNRIGVVKYKDEENSQADNLALICRSCRSRMRSNKSIDGFRAKQKELLLRDIKKLSESIEFNFSKDCKSIHDLSEFVSTNEIEFPNERN